MIESRLEPKRGIAATIIIKNGTLKRSQFVVAGGAFTTTRIMENFLGKTVESVSAGTPVQLTGFDELPEVGASIKTFDKKRDAEDYIEEMASTTADTRETGLVGIGKKVVPIIIKPDVHGTLEAIAKELKKISIAGLYIKLIGKALA